MPERFIWWSSGTTKTTLYKEIEVFSKAKGSAEYNLKFTQWAAIQSVMPFSASYAIDAVLYAALDEGCIPEPSLTSEERKVLEDVFSGTKASADVGDTKLALLCRHLEALKYMLYSG